MRLTLRTLLAYLDGVLDADDAQDLQRKIENSPLAQDLVQRIEETLRSAPPEPMAPLAVGEADANLVAEYLDSTLRPELEPEFERQCLEADERLEEVAACHQILSMVVRERTAVPQEVRQRIHALREQLGFGGEKLPGPPQTLESRPGAWLNPPGAAPGEGSGRYVPPSTDEVEQDDEGDEPTYTATGDTSDQRWRREERWRDEDEDVVTSEPVKDVGYDSPSSVATPVLPDVLEESSAPGRALPVLMVGILALIVGLFFVQPQLLTQLTQTLRRGESPGRVSPPANAAPMEGKPQPRTAPPVAPHVEVDGPAKPASSVPPASFAAPVDAQSPPHVGVPMGRGGETHAPPALLPPANPIADGEGLAEPPANTEPAMPPTPDTIAPVAPEEGVAAIRQPSRLRPADALESRPEPSPEVVTAPEGGATEREVDPTVDVAPAPERGDLASHRSSTPLLESSPALPAKFPGDELVGEEANAASVPAAEGEEHAGVPGELPAIDAPSSPDLIAALPTAPKPEVPPTSPVATPAGPIQLRLSSERDAVMQSEDSGPAWTRVASTDPMPLGRVLVVLPTYRSHVVVNRGLKLTIVGPSEWVFRETSSSDLLIEMRYGKVLAELEPDQSEATLDWAANGQTASVKLSGGGTVVALSAWQVLPPGSDPIADGGAGVRRVTQVTVLNGAAVWNLRGTETVLRTESTWNLVDAAAGFATPFTGRMPWMDGSDVVPIDQRASRELEPFLPSGGAVLPVLQERVADDRHVEQQSLAARCLVALGEFGSPWESLRQPSQRSYWLRTIESLREALARSPQTAQKIQETVEQNRAGEGRFLYRMLRGYSQDDLDRGGAAELVSALGAESLDLRVLASENLSAITGVRNYRPADSVKSRTIYLKRWQSMLANGQIRYARNVSPVPVPATSGAGPSPLK